MTNRMILQVYLVIFKVPLQTQLTRRTKATIQATSYLAGDTQGGPLPMGYPDGFYLTACGHLPKKLSGAILALSGGY
jgi:hypothetical protein